MRRTVEGIHVFHSQEAWQAVKNSQGIYEPKLVEIHVNDNESESVYMQRKNCLKNCFVKNEATTKTKFDDIPERVKAAMLEIANWQNQMTDIEKSEMTVSKAQKEVLYRIYLKHAEHYVKEVPGFKKVQKSSLKLDLKSDRYRECPECMTGFMAKHLNKKFCSKSCKMSYNNRKGREKYRLTKIQLQEIYKPSNFKKYRLRLGLTMDQVSKKTGVNQVYISLLERNQIQKPDIQKTQTLNNFYKDQLKTITK